MQPVWRLTTPWVWVSKKRNNFGFLWFIPSAAIESCGTEKKFHILYIHKYIFGWAAEWPSGPFRASVDTIYYEISFDWFYWIFFFRLCFVYAIRFPRWVKLLPLRVFAPPRQPAAFQLMQLHDSPSQDESVETNFDWHLIPVQMFAVGQLLVIFVWRGKQAWWSSESGSS